MASHGVFTFAHPTTIIIAGPTRSGKTFFVQQLLKHSLIQPCPNRVIWFYKEYQPLYDAIKLIIPSAEFIHNIDASTLETLTVAERNLVVIDDLMTTAGDSKQIGDLFTQESHHKNLTVIFIVQNLFHQGATMRTISLNAHYFVLYKNPRDKSQVKFLSQQIYPDNSKFLVNVYQKATEEPHSYLLIDLHPETQEKFRIVTNIFPGEQIRFYLPV